MSELYYIRAVFGQEIDKGPRLETIFRWYAETYGHVIHPTISAAQPRSHNFFAEVYNLPFYTQEEAALFCLAFPDIVYHETRLNDDAKALLLGIQEGRLRYDTWTSKPERITLHDLLLDDIIRFVDDEHFTLTEFGRTTKKGLQ